MIRILAGLYNSKSAAMRIPKMPELMTTRYRTMQDDMAKHVDRKSGLFEKLRSMKTVLDD